MLTIAELEKMKTDKFRVLITMVPPRPAKDGDLTRAALEAAGLPMFVGSIRNLKAFEKAATAGVIVSEVPDPRAGYGWDDYVAIGKELVR
jgi:chromosome partitioning protein